MNEDENDDRSPSGGQDYEGDEDDGSGEYNATEETAEDEDASQGSQGDENEEKIQTQEEPLTRAQIRELGPAVDPTELNELAAELGFTPAQLAKVGNLFGRIASHTSAAAGISNAHLQDEVAVAPGLRSHVAAIQRNLSGLKPEAQTNRKNVQWAIFTTFVEQAKSDDTTVDIVKRMVKACGLKLAPDNASQSRQETQTARSTPRVPSTSIGAGARTQERRQEQDSRRNAPTGAVAFLAQRSGIKGREMDVLEDDVRGNQRVF
jgi:hypothetical protein